MFKGEILEDGDAVILTYSLLVLYNLEGLCAYNHIQYSNSSVLYELFLYKLKFRDVRCTLYVTKVTMGRAQLYPQFSDFEIMSF